MELHELSYAAVFMTGLLGGIHCAGMCGGIVSALGMVTQRSPAHSLKIPVSLQVANVNAMASLPSSQRTSHISTLLSASAYNLGRLMTYTTLGALAGGVGSSAWLMQSLLPIQQVAFFISNVLLVAMGLYVLGVKRISTVVESLGKVFWEKVRPYATATLKKPGWLNAIAAGSLWGLVPCGMIYAVLATALVSGSAVRGALLMLTFGLGTLPNLMALGLSGQWLACASRKRPVRLGAGCLIIGFGLAGLMHLSMMETGIHHAT